MPTLTCDHCGEFQCEYDNIPAIMWCRNCIDLDYPLLERVGLLYDYGPTKRFVWLRPNSINLIKAIPKKTDLHPILKKIDVSMSSKVIEKKPCSRAYYGMPECTCGKCPPQRRPINTNPFRYGI